MLLNLFDMCYRPLHLKNMSNHYDPESMPLYFECPCGKCEDCRDAKRSEWYVRSYFHWLHYRSIGGCAWFYTLTFNDEHLPRYNGVPCFDKDVVVKFVKRLKEKLERELSTHLDYLICCEYGELLKRPHMHALFFTDKQLMPWTFYNCVDSTWQQGFVYAGSNGGIVTGSSGILYVTKYVCKDSSYNKLDDVLKSMIFKDYEDMYNSFASSHSEYPQTWQDLLKNHKRWTNTPEVISWYNGAIKSYRDKSSFKCQSLGLGSSMLSSTYLNERDETILVLMGNKYKPVPLPRYIKRKLFYDRVPNERDGKLNRYVLNVKGKQHYIDTLDEKIDTLSLNMMNFLKNTRLTDYQFMNLDTHFKFQTRQDLNDFLCNLNIDFRKLAIYYHVYRNRFEIRQSFDYFTEYKDYLSNLFSICENKANVPLSELTPKEINYINNHMFNFNPIFEPYEHLSLLYDQMASLIRKESAFVRLERTEQKRKLKDVITISKLKVV